MKRLELNSDLSLVTSNWRFAEIRPKRQSISIERLQRLFRAGPDGDAFRQVHPADNACGINQEFGRAGDVSPVRSGASVQQVVASDHFGLSAHLVVGA